jgi:hypothetical protein
MRSPLVALLAVLAAAAPASAAIPAPHPLTGEGENVEIVGNLPLDTSDVAASDIEMHGDYAFIGSYSEGLVIADISDPAKPKRAGVFACGGGSQYDVQLSADANLAVLSSDSTGASCLPAGQSGSMIIDTSDKANPTMTGFIPVAVGTHTHTLDDRILYVNNYPTSYSKLEVFDLTNPGQPTRIGELSFGGDDSIHDSFVDHRPDGRTLLYAASIGFTDVIDVSDPRTPTLLQRIADPAVTIAHQAEPSPARDVLIVTDEFQGGADTPACGRAPGIDSTFLIPGLGDLADTGAIHFYKLAADGTLAENGAAKVGIFNLPFATPEETGGCTSHVLWQAPDQNRFVAAWYGRGTRVVDYTDPSAATQTGYFVPTGANTWSAKPHRGYIFTGDINRGMDVLRPAGEGWPATAGPQEAQRAAYRSGTAGTGAPPTQVPSNPPPAGAGVGGGGSEARKAGGARVKATLRIPGRKGRRKLLTATFRKASGSIAARLRFRKQTGRRKLQITLAGDPGRYRFVIRAGVGGKVLKRGTVTVKESTSTNLQVVGGQTLVCRVR